MLKSIIDESLETGFDAKLIEYLTSNSNLPGPRGNLELANLFAKNLADYPPQKIVKLWGLCLKMTRISATEAPVNTPQEFIPFCGTVGMSSIAAKNSSYFNDALNLLEKLATDSRWRMREAVAMALQKLISAEPGAVINELNIWINSEDLLKLRAIVAGVAEPAILKNKEVAREAFQLNQKVVQKLKEIKDRKTESFRVLRKALAYTLSVVIVSLPKEGFEFLNRLVKIDDPDIKWIIRENLKKNRLIKNFPTEVNALKKSLN